MINKKKPASYDAGFFLFLACHRDQAAGGIGSLLDGAAGFLRRVRKPTTMGIAMKIKDRQSMTNPYIGGKV
jgi:hypothetical protein